MFVSDYQIMRESVILKSDTKDCLIMHSWGFTSNNFLDVTSRIIMFINFVAMNSF